MAIYTDPKYRIRRNADQEEQMRYLVNDLKIFQSYSQILMISAVVGYKNKLYVPIENYASDGVLMQFFTQRDLDFMDFIAYAYKKEQSILKNNDKYEIFESFANGGFPVVLDELKIDFVDKKNNDRLEILRRYYRILLQNGFNC